MKTGIRAGKAYKDGYKRYQLDGRERKNKIKRLERHVKRFPDDKQAEKSLAEIRKGNFNRRKKPISSNLEIHNSPIKQIYELTGDSRMTAGEQLSKLLGIVQPYKCKQKTKAPIKYRKRKNVKKP